jgi:hypothetical protein
MRRLLAAAVAIALLLPGCVEPRDTSEQPREGRAGLQLAGTLRGRQLAVSDGSPSVLVQDCDPRDGIDEDLCVVARDIDGELVVLSFENPEALVEDEVLRFTDACARPEECDAVRESVVLDVQHGSGPRRRVTAGELRLEVVEPGERYVGRLRLILPNGTLAGSFDLVPRPER